MYTLPLQPAHPHSALPVYNLLTFETKSTKFILIGSYWHISLTVTVSRDFKGMVPATCMRDGVMTLMSCSRHMQRYMQL